MAVKVTLTNSARVTKKLTSLSGEDLTFSRIIYQRLNSLIANKTILADYILGNLPKEYIDFLDDLNKVTTGEETEEIAVLNIYLGNLGVTEEYPYNKDTVDIPLWYDADASTPIRNVAYNTDNVINGTDNIVRII